MGKLIAPWIWASQFAPVNKHLIWKKSNPADGSIVFMKYNAGWKEIEYKDISRPEFIMPATIPERRPTAQPL